MKKMKSMISALTCVGLIFLFASCGEHQGDKKGTVTFGANYHIINCISTVTIYVDGENIGTLQHSVDAITACGQEENLTKELSVGEHTYRVEIRPENGIGCTRDVNGTFTVAENECTKIFLDYLQIFSTPSDCDHNVIVSPTEYENVPGSFFNTQIIGISGNCLTIRFVGSGCDGSSWVMKLVDSGSIAESNPCQRWLKCFLESTELCEALITKEASFNIEDLQISGDNKVLLRINGEDILYEY